MGEGSGESKLFKRNGNRDGSAGVTLPDRHPTFVMPHDGFTIMRNIDVKQVGAPGIVTLTEWGDNTAIWEDGFSAWVDLCNAISGGCTVRI